MKHPNLTCDFLPWSPRYKNQTVDHFLVRYILNQVNSKLFQKVVAEYLILITALESSDLYKKLKFRSSLPKINTNPRYLYTVKKKNSSYVQEG